jgi:hypothetical protein
MNPMVDPDRHAGADPIGAWATTRDSVLRALDRPGVLDRVVSTMQGDQRVDDMIAFNVADTTVHNWDLARSGEGSPGRLGGTAGVAFRIAVSDETHCRMNVSPYAS